MEFDRSEVTVEDGRPNYRRQIKKDKLCWNNDLNTVTSEFF